jgi:hypothetical protein
MANGDTVILDCMNYLQTLNRTITLDSGAHIKAPEVAFYPTVLDTPNLPMVITWPGAGEHWLKGGGWHFTERTYRILVYLQVLNQDDIPSRAVYAATLFGKFVHLYSGASVVAAANPPPYQLTLESGPQGPHHSDDGLVPSLSFGGRAFLGFELAIKTRAQWT